MGKTDSSDAAGFAEPMQIGDLAARTGVTAETLRYYEGRGLLQPSRRRANRYREYAPDAIHLVRFIKTAQSLGFTLSEVEDLVRLRERAWAGDATRLLREAIDTKLREIDRRVRELRSLGNELSALINACDKICPPLAADGADTVVSDGDAAVPDCPLVEALDADAVREVRTEGSDAAGPDRQRTGRSPKPGRRVAARSMARQTQRPQSSRR